MATISSARITQLIEKTNHYDQDERYMALHDICQDLIGKEGSSSSAPLLDNLSEKRLVGAILDRLEKDTINDVKAISVKALSLLVKRVSKESNEEIASRLLKSLSSSSGAGAGGAAKSGGGGGGDDSGGSSLRDVFSIGLKNLISDAPASQGASVTGVIVPALLTGLQDKRQEVRQETLELTVAILNRFGNLVDKASSPMGSSSSSSSASAAVVGGAPAGFLYGLLEQGLKLLMDPAAPIRKRAVAVVGALSLYLSDLALDTCVRLLLQGIEAHHQKTKTTTLTTAAAGKNAGYAAVAVAAAASTPPLAAADPRTLIQTLSAVSRVVGWRLAGHLPRIVPILLAEMGSPTDESEAAHSEKENEIRECCLQAFESFVVRSPKVIQPFLEEIAKTACLPWLRYDPNYAGGDDDDANGGAGSSSGFDEDGNEDNNEDDEDADWGDDDDDAFGGGMGDEDDTSWKVRRAAVKLASSFITSKSGGGPSLSHAQLLAIVAPALQRCINDREETVKMEVLSACGELFRSTNLSSVAAAAAGSSVGASSASGAAAGGSSAASASGGGGGGLVAGEDETSAAFGPCSLLPPQIAGTGVSTGVVATAGSGAAAAAAVAAATAASAASSSSPSSAAASEAELAVVLSLLPTMIPRVLKLLAVKKPKEQASTAKARTATLSLFRSILQVAAAIVGGAAGAAAANAPGIASLNGALPQAIAVVSACLREKSHAHSQSLRLEACCCLHALLVFFGSSVAASAGAASTSSAPAALVAALPAIKEAAEDSWYRLAAEGLRTVAVTVTVLRPASASAARRTLAAPASDISSRFSEVASSLFATVHKKLSAPELDQEVKETAVLAAAAVLAHCADIVPALAGDAFSSSAGVGAVLKIFSERWKAESTRLVTLRALCYLVSSPFFTSASAASASFAGRLVELSVEVAAFVKQIQRPVKQQALQTLALLFTVIAGSGAANAELLKATTLAPALSAASALMEEGDLQLTAQVLRLACAVAAVGTAAAGTALQESGVLSKSVKLAVSPTIQGGALQSLFSFLAVSATVLGKASPEFSFGKLLPAIVSSAAAAAAASVDGASSSSGAGAGGSAAGGAAGTASSKCLAVLLKVAGAEASAPTVQSFLAQGCEALSSGSSGSLANGGFLYLQSLGEAGKAGADIAGLAAAAGPNSNPNAASAIASLLAGSAGHQIDDVRWAASFALGGICVGSSQAALPVLVSALQTALAASASASASSAAAGAAGAGAGAPAASSVAGAGSVPPGSSSSTSSAAVTAATNDRSYFFLSSLKEFLLAHQQQHLSLTAATAETVSAVLVRDDGAGASDEGVRSMVAECLGRLTAMAPEVLVPKVASLASSSSSSSAGEDAAAFTAPNKRWTAVSSLRFAIASEEAQALLASSGAMLALASLILDAQSLAVRGATVGALTALASHPTACAKLLLPLCAGKPALSADRFPLAEANPGLPHQTAAGLYLYSAGNNHTLAPARQPADVTSEGLLACLYYEALPRADLMREVDLGPFKHRYDDGLPIRKAAFACLDSLLFGAPANACGLSSLVGNHELKAVVCSGLRDLEDVKLLTHALVGKMVGSAATAGAALPGSSAAAGGGGNKWHAWILEHLTDISSALSSAFAKVFTGQGGEGDEPSLDVKRSTIRCIDTIARGVVGAYNGSNSNSRSFTELYQRIARNDPALVAIYQNLLST